MTRKHALTILAASAAVAVAIGIPALGALSDPAERGETSAARGPDDQGGLWRLADDDDDDHHDRHHRDRRASRDRDHHDDCDDDEVCARPGMAPGMAPGPMGTGTPPQNKLFGTGAPPQVKVN